MCSPSSARAAIFTWRSTARKSAARQQKPGAREGAGRSWDWRVFRNATPTRSPSHSEKLKWTLAGHCFRAHFCKPLKQRAFSCMSGTIELPYKGGGPAMNDVIAGHVALNMASIQVAKGLVESGKIKRLAVTSAERSPVLPNVPTLTEAGVQTANVDLRFWFGIFAPTGIPDVVKAKLEKAVSTTLSNPLVRERLANLDIEPGYAGGNVLKAKLTNEIANWTKFIDAHGIKPE